MYTVSLYVCVNMCVCVNICVYMCDRGRRSPCDPPKSTAGRLVTVHVHITINSGHIVLNPLAEEEEEASQRGAMGLLSCNQQWRGPGSGQSAAQAVLELVDGT